MDNKLKTWPERIYLQHSEDGYPVPHYKVETDEITWCEDRQYDSDVEYVRADLLSQQVEAARNAALESEVVRLNAIIDYYGCDDSDAGCVAAINRALSSPAQAEQKGKEC